MDSSDTPTDILAKDVVLQHGEEFGEYCVEDCVTSGLMGRIYRVLHMDNSEAYSICVLPHRASKDARLGGRLRRYAQQASELVHPNLVNIIEWKIIRGRFCLIMEPITGSSLQKVRRDKLQDLDEGFDAIEWETTEEHTSGEIVIPSTFGFGEQWAKEIVTNLVEVLTYLQEKRLAHSALSPDYIFVDSSGRVQSALGGLLAVLGRPLFEVIVSSEISPVNSATEEREINVIDVMSPEVQSGSAPTIESDLYALGTLVYWMFTGRQFSALPTYVALGTFRPDVKEYWSEIADALLEADPEARLDSPSSLIYRMSEPEVNAAATDLTVDTEVEVAEEPEKPKAKTKRGPLIASLSIIALVVVVALGALVFMFSGGETAGNEVVAAVEVAAQAPEVPQWVEVAFESVAGAQILAIDEAGTEITLGSISDGGMLSVSEVLEAGTYRFQIQHENYRGITTEPYALTVEEFVSVKVPLEPLPSQAEIWTIPNGAEITVNGVARGQSPIRLTGLPSEVPLTITASLEGRRSESQSITLEPNSGVVIDFGEFEMQQAFIMPKIALSGETNPQIVDLIDISLDGETVTLNETGMLELAPGSHRLAASHPDYRSAEQVFEIQDAEEVELSMILEPKPGIVRVLGPLPENARLLVNRRVVEFPRTGEILMAVTPRREHEVVIEALNYHPFRTLVTIDPNRTQDLVPILERIAGPERETSWTLPYIQMQMMWIPTGQFSFGSPLPEHARLPNEGPIRTRNMESSFWIGAHEVTQRIYRAVMQKNPSLFEGLENPVDSVSWDDAMAFCAKLTEIEREAERLPVGYEYRLPSEVEWEYAARAGTNSPYFWGGYAHNSLGNFSGVYPRGSSYDGQGRDHYGTIQVGSFAANPWGLFDVHGNVREWTLDVYGSKPPRELDLGIGNTSDFLRRTQRGGGWEDNAPACRSAARLAVSPELQSHAVGFRVVLAKKVDSTEG